MLPERTREVIRMLSVTVDAKGDNFPGHSNGVAYLVSMMAHAGGFDPRHVYAIQIAGLMHDVGKIGVPDAILAAAAPAERDGDGRHDAGIRSGDEQIARAMQGTEAIAPWIRHHHERVDGRGIPTAWPATTSRSSPGCCTSPMPST